MQTSTLVACPEPGQIGRVMPGRASGVKVVGMAEVRAPISLDGWIYLDCWCICLCYLHFAPENPEDGKQRYDFWVSPCVAPTRLCKQEVEKPSQNAAQPCVRVQGYVNDDLRADGRRRGLGFQVSTCLIDR